MHYLELTFSESRFRLLSESAQDMVYLYSLEPIQGFEYVSPAVKKITGYSQEEFLEDAGLGIKLVYPWGDMIKDTQKQLDALPEESFVQRWQHKNGKWRWLEQCSSPIYDKKGKMVAIQGIVRDVTERKESEARDLLLHEVVLKVLNEEPIESILQYVSEQLLILGDYCLVCVGLKLADGSILIPAKAGEVGHLQGLEILWDDTPAGSGAEGRAIKTGTTQVLTGDAINFLPWCKRLDSCSNCSKAILPLNVQGATLGALCISSRRNDVFTSKQLFHLEGFAHQVAAAVQAAKTKQAVRLHAKALESADNAIVITDPRGTVQWVNPAFSKLTGYGFEEIKGRKPSLLKSGQQDENFYKNLWQHIGSAKTWSGEIINRRKDGSLYTEEMTIAPVLDEKGKIENYIAVKQDISERKLAENVLWEHQRQLQIYTKSLEVANRELDEFAFIVSHDLKSPLRAILNLSTWIEEDLGNRLQGDTQKYLGLLRQRVTRMESLIDDILQYSRSGRNQASQEKVVVKELLEEIIEELSPEKGFSIEIGPNMPVINTQRVKLKQIFANLIGNALKHHHSNVGQVHITSEPFGDDISFVITDDGPGIAKEYHEKIFKIFNTLNNSPDSTGIGLAIVKKIVEEQGGKISVQSEQGQGAAFYFTWPLQLNR